MKFTMTFEGEIDGEIESDGTIQYFEPESMDFYIGKELVHVPQDIARNFFNSLSMSQQEIIDNEAIDQMSKEQKADLEYQLFIEGTYNDYRD